MRAMKTHLKYIRLYIDSRTKDNVNLADVIDELIEERGLDREVLSSIVCEGMLSAFQKKYPDIELKAEYDQKIGSVVVFVQKKVVSAVEDDYREISLKKARKVDKNLNLADMVWLPFEDGIGRIEILRARQVIASNIRKVEAAAVYDEFKEKEGEIIHGVIHKCERGGTVIKLEETLAFLKKRNIDNY